MKILIILLFLSMSFSKAEMKEESKPKATDQALEVEEVEVIEEVTTAKTENNSKAEKAPEANQSDSKEPAVKPMANQSDSKEPAVKPMANQSDSKEPAVKSMANQPDSKEPAVKPMANQPDSKGPAVTEPVAVEVTETELVSIDTGIGVSAEAGVKYVCDEGRSYTFYEPGKNSSHLCELDAGHTEQLVDWYALNNVSFCKNKIEELISQYNCSKETK